MNKNEISAVISDHIKSHPGTSYAELENVFNDNGFDFRGDKEACSEVNENVIFWSGWSEEAFEIIAGLIKSGKIERIPCQPYIYLIDGKALTLPILKGDPNRIKRPHWLPCVFNAC